MPENTNSTESHDHTGEHPCQECVMQNTRTIKQRIGKFFAFLPAPARSFLLRHKWKVTIGVVIFALLSYGYYAITREPAPEYITAEVTRGELVQTVEAVGTVTSERDLNLQFPVSGVVGEIRVKEGDTVEAGERLASLRSGDLAAAVTAAKASLQAAQADLQELQEGTRPEDIRIAEAEVENKIATLNAAREQLTATQEELTLLQKEAQVNLVGEIGKARSSVSQQLTKAKTSIAVFDDVISDNDVHDALVRGEPGLENLLNEGRNAAEDILHQVEFQGVNFDNYTDALQSLHLTRSGIVSTSNAVDSLFSAIISVPPTSSFTRSERESRKEDLNTEKSNLQTALTTLDASIKSLQDASATYDTKIATKQTAIAGLKGDILTYETSLRTQQASLELKRAGARQTEIDAAAAKVRQEQANLSRAQSDFADTILTAPVDGFITKVNIKTGELLSTAFQQDAAITMLGESPYRIEMYASEIDIPKVEVGQEAQVELDAFPNQPFALTVGEVDPAATSVDGVPKYRIKLDFVEPPERLKIGMTGDTDIFTGRREDVVSVPARAVIEGENGKMIVRVLNNDGTIEEREVQTGLEGENDIEILSGVEEGETVVVLIKQ